jgi:hypothetical protein
MATSSSTASCATPVVLSTLTSKMWDKLTRPAISLAVPPSVANASSTIQCEIGLSVEFGVSSSALRNVMAYSVDSAFSLTIRRNLALSSVCVEYATPKCGAPS